MRLLLDTHIWLWIVGGSDRLSAKVLQAVRDPQNDLWLSPISIWEAMLLAERGRILVRNGIAAFLDDAIARTVTQQAPITHEIARQSRLVRLPHQDPADRFLAATAKVLDLTLVTADDVLLRSREFAVLANR